MKKIVMISLSIILVLHTSHLLAHDHKLIHRMMTENAANNITFDNYLRQELHFKDGFKTPIPANGGKSILTLLHEGSTAEDALTICRATNHFHDPAKSWDTAGLSDYPFWLWVICGGTYYSNLTWATGFLSPDGAPIPANLNNPNSPNVWGVAREKYRNALTATAKEARETYFAETFSAVAQVMHLIQDLSVPAHVRNDFASHWGICKGEKCSSSLSKWRNDNFELYVALNSPLVSIAGSKSSDLTNPKLTDFWDTERFNGLNPSAGLSQGLAEYTRANYFSDSTIFNNLSDPSFFYPQVNQENSRICEDYEPDERLIKRKYISRTACPPLSEARLADHFATPSLINDEGEITDQNISLLKLWLDDNVHKTYAGELLPLAIGYSSQVLNYFFRGKIDLITSPEYPSGYTIVNESEEEMEGNFTIYYDDKNEQRKPLWNRNFSIGAKSSDNNHSGLIIDIPELPNKYILVFQGRMGSETKAVAGKSKTGDWEPWFLNPATSDPHDFTEIHPWYYYRYPTDREPFSIIKNPSSEPPGWANRTVLNYYSQTPPGGDANDGIIWSTAYIPMQETIKIPKGELYFKVRSNILALPPSQNPPPASGYWNALELRDIHGKTLVIYFSTNWAFGANLDENEITIPDAANGNPQAEDDGVNPISLYPLKDEIRAVRLDGGYDDNITANWQVDFIRFR